MKNEGPLTEKRGAWVLPIAGNVVTQIRIDYTFEVVVEEVHIRIATAFDVEGPLHSGRIDPEDTPSLGALLSLHSIKATSGIVRKDGLLTLDFADGTRITVQPDERYEAWTVHGEYPPVRNDFTLIARPGGGLASL